MTLPLAREQVFAFVDEQCKGPYSLWHHTHTFEETDKGTAIGDRVLFRLPLWPLGEIVLTLLDFSSSEFSPTAKKRYIPSCSANTTTCAVCNRKFCNKRLGHRENFSINRKRKNADTPSHGVFADDVLEMQILV